MGLRLQLPLLNNISFDLSGLVIAEDKKTASGTVIVTYGTTSYNFDLSTVITDAWSNGTDYLYTIDLENSLVCIGIYISPEYGDSGLSIDVSDYVK